MRTLCLNFHKPIDASTAEYFLALSPRVYYREPGFIFADISSTSCLFGGEGGLLKEALSISKKFLSPPTSAIGDSPVTAQALSFAKDSHISAPAEDSNELQNLPLSLLVQLEGLVAWRSSQDIEEIVSFFEILGFDRIGQLKNFEIDSFRERWGLVGAQLWKRIHGEDQQVISPLLPSEALNETVCFDFSISLQSFLQHSIEQALKRLTHRLECRGEFVRKIHLDLYCEFSKLSHLIEVIPFSPHRDPDMLLKLIEHQLANVDLENPIAEFHLNIISCPEKTRQLDFFETPAEEPHRLQQLMTLFQQSSLTSGFLTPTNEIMPEDAWEIQNEYTAYELLEGETESSPDGFRHTPSYSQHLSSAPRPHLLLETPQLLSSQEVNRLQFLSPYPIERLEEGWWSTSRGRDYYIALAHDGPCQWIFYDRLSQDYFLHGYFD